MRDCYIYSSLAYLQLNQHEQAISILNELIDCDNENDKVQSLILRSRAFEMKGNIEIALKDLYSAQHIDGLNKIVKTSIEKLLRK